MNTFRDATLAGFYRGRTVLVLGDTGFKGSWLCEWLVSLQADVHGAGLPPRTEPALYEILQLQRRITHQDVDVRDRQRVRRLLREVRPDVVFHLAAQSLVKTSYLQPLATLDTNVIGTANVLAAVHACRYTPESPCAVIVVTSDKCYRNDERGEPFAERDPLGGHDLYSASKAMAELLVAAWRDSFCTPGAGVPAVRLATARAGNVLGGGDWAPDRIAVDAVRALALGDPIAVRNPHARRPWQHVLEPLSGYLALGQRLWTTPGQCESAWNFGPGPGGECTVGELCDAFTTAWGGGNWQARPTANPVTEATVLRLAIDKARAELGWQPTWDFVAMVRHVVDWYRRGVACGHDPTTMIELTQQQIAAFTAERTAVEQVTATAGTAR